MKFIDEVIIKHKRVLLRVDFNVPLKADGSIADDSRIRETVPTIKYLLDNQNKVIIVSHLGRPDAPNKHDSLEKVTLRLHRFLPDYYWHFIADFMTNSIVLTKQRPREFAVLENIRFYPGEETNDREFAKRLAKLADVYVNDAFAVCHRKAASIAAITKYLPSYGGLLLKKEIKMLSKITENPAKPLVAIIGGKKIASKIKFISKLTRIANYLLLAGGLANTFLAARGFEIGRSIYCKEELGQANYLTAIARRHGTKIILPEDAITGQGSESDKSRLKLITQIAKRDEMLDIGPKTQAEYATVISRAKTIIWNGPLGYFENPLYGRGTDFIYYAIEQNPKAVSIIGGGDTIAAIADRDNLDRITHISTGGGAMLAFIEHGTLVGIEALKNCTKGM